MLFIPAKIEYGLTLLIFLAEHQNESPFSLGNIARSTNMPYRFLTQVVKPLLAGSIISAKEGKGGGYRLSVNPKKITVKEIFNILGEPLYFTNCLNQHKSCPGDKNCKMKVVWQKVKRNIDQELSELSLADLV